ncbi:MAG TPA: amidohydrolase family protein [Chloroflexota bacterium]|nr:amidohydrolase family protein [Chloroflexota bacterium]
MPARTASRVIDADSHVMEPAETWAYLPAEYEARKPFIITGENKPFLQGMNSFWYIDGKTFPQPVGRGVSIYATPVTQARATREPWALGSQTLLDVPERLADMDRAGIDVQVNFPTLFLEPLTEDPGLEAALIRSYNTFMAERARQAPERLKWAALLPLQDPDRAADEVRWAREHGAVCAGTTYCTVGDVGLDDARFDVVWQALERAGLPLCLHCGWSVPDVRRLFNTSYGSHALGFTLPLLCAFYAFLGGGVLDRYPRLKLGFLEAGCEWIPWLVQRMDHYFEAEAGNGRPLPAARASEYLRSCQVYFTTEAEEASLPHVLGFVGDDRVMISGDMPHSEARDNAIAEIEEREDLTAEQKRKLLHDNAARFYAL